VQLPENFSLSDRGPTELRDYGVLGSLLSASNAQVTAKIAHFSDTPASVREYATRVTDKGTP
jgi:hypothetical protein